MSEKRYRVFSEHLKQTFGGRVHKISVDAGFSCPNRGGPRELTGCLFCDPGGSGAVGIDRGFPVAEQIERGKEVMLRKYKAKKFIAYFQPFSNTNAPVARLRMLYDQALAVDGVVGLAVGTRPDCLSPEVLDLLAEYHRRTDFWLEIGLQSIHDATLAFLRRGHDYLTFLRAFQGARARGLQVCVHVILGLPGETREQMLATADEMARLRVDGIKIHLLHVLEGTPLGELYQQGGIKVLEQDAYVSLAADFLERLHPETFIHRLTGDGPRDLLLGPLWSLNKWEVLNAIDAELEKRGSHQGSEFLGIQGKAPLSPSPEGGTSGIDRVWSCASGGGVPLDGGRTLRDGRFSGASPGNQEERGPDDADEDDDCLEHGAYITPGPRLKSRGD